MKWIGAISAFQEEGRIGAAVESLYAAGCADVFVLDGAWKDPAGNTFGGGPEFSTDGTVEEAVAAGARFARWSGGDDAAKQTQLLARCGAEPGDYVVKIDADERIRGRLIPPSGHSLVWLRNHGANDIPDVRSTWPRGDDARYPIPLFRAFQWSRELVCVRPGRWQTSAGSLEPYLVGALARLLDSIDIAYDHPLSQLYRQLRDIEAKTNPRDAAAFPILDDVWIDHYRDPGKADAKRAYYEAAA